MTIRLVPAPSGAILVVAGCNHNLVLNSHTFGTDNNGSFIIFYRGTDKITTITPSASTIIRRIRAIITCIGLHILVSRLYI